MNYKFFYAPKLPGHGTSLDEVSLEEEPNARDEASRHRFLESGNFSFVHTSIKHEEPSKDENITTEFHDDKEKSFRQLELNLFWNSIDSSDDKERSIMSRRGPQLGFSWKKHKTDNKY